MSARETGYHWKHILWIQNQTPLLAGNMFSLEQHFVHPKAKATCGGNFVFVGTTLADPKPKAAFGRKLVSVRTTFCGSETKSCFWRENDFCWMTFCGSKTKRLFWREIGFCWSDILWIQNQKPLLAGNWFLLEGHFVDPKLKAAFGRKLDIME